MSKTRTMSAVVIVCCVKQSELSQAGLVQSLVTGLRRRESLESSHSVKAEETRRRLRQLLTEELWEPVGNFRLGWLQSEEAAINLYLCGGRCCRADASIS